MLKSIHKTIVLSLRMVFMKKLFITLLLLILTVATGAAAFFLFQISTQLHNDALSAAAKEKEIKAQIVKENSKKLDDWTQYRTCMALDTDAALACATGTKVVFIPTRYGNPQLTIYLVGIACDLSKTVVYNEGGFTCIKAPNIDEINVHFKQKDEIKLNIRKK